MKKLKSLLNESFGIGDLPSSKLIKMKKTLAEIMADDKEASIDEALSAKVIDKLTSFKELSTFIKKNKSALSKGKYFKDLMDELGALKYLESDLEAGDADKYEVETAIEEIQDQIKQILNLDESVSEGTDDMDRLQEINVDFSQFIKKNLKKIKMLPTDTQKQFGKLFGDFKNGLDDLSDDTNESVVTEAVKEVTLSNEILNFLEERGVIKASDSQKIHKDLTAFLKKNLNESVNEIKKGSIVMPYAMDKHGEFIVDKVFKNKDGETSYIGKFKKSGETREFILHSKDKIVKESVNEAKIAFVNDKLVGDRIQNSGLLPLLGDNNVSLNPNKVKFTRELRDTLVKLYKKYSSLTIK